MSHQIVRWSLDELPDVLRELGIERPFFVASPRWTAPVDVAGRWSEIPSDRARVDGDADGLLAIGGGSAIDTAKWLSATTASATAGGACAAVAAARTTRRSSTTCR